MPSEDPSADSNADSFSPVTDPADTASDRESPVGEPVVRGDPQVTGEYAREAVQFDPGDPDSLADAAETVRSFAASRSGDNVYVLRGAASCAALVRGEGSYRAAAERAGEDVTVSFICKWARVHDLPRPVRRHVALGHIAPSAAKHIARVNGSARYSLAWATLDHDLTVREVRELASEIADGATVDAALRGRGIDPGEIEVRLEADTYGELRRRVALDEEKPDDVVASALDSYLPD